jgi:hypothetical protein
LDCSCNFAYHLALSWKMHQWKHRISAPRTVFELMWINGAGLCFQLWTMGTCDPSN